MRIETRFQNRVTEWIETCFGISPHKAKKERNHRFLEEALELSQALGCSEEEAVELVRYVFSRSIGNPAQEVGGVMLTLAALCSANNLDMEDLGEAELKRVWANIDSIRRKRELRKINSPLP